MLAVCAPLALPALLNPETREWLNVGKYGKPLQPTGAGGEAAAAGDGAGPTWRSM